MDNMIAYSTKVLVKRTKQPKQEFFLSENNTEEGEVLSIGFERPENDPLEVGNTILFDSNVPKIIINSDTILIERRHILIITI